MTERNWKAILEDAKARGLHRAAVARELGVTRSRLTIQCEAYGIDLPRGRHGQKPRHDWAKVLKDAAKAGKTLGEVARETCVSKPAVCKNAKKLGVRLRDPRHAASMGIAA